MKDSHTTPVDGTAVDLAWEPNVSCGSSPTRGGTMDWDDRIVMAAAEAPCPAHVASKRTGASPIRGGTRDWDELLPAALMPRYRTRGAALQVSPTRGGTLSWDDLLESMRADVNQMVFEPPGRGRDDSSVEEMLQWLAPPSEKARK